MPNHLAAIRADLSKFADDLAGDEIKHVAGQAAKKAALTAAERDAGADRVLSGFRRRSARLNAGYDLEAGSSLTLNLAPKGLWMLMNDGRRAKPGVITPRRRRTGGSKALNTPWGPRANVKPSSSRGLGTLADAEKAIEADTFAAVDRAVLNLVRKF